MKCATHNTEANAVCAYCGRALCPECSKPHSGQRMACSAVCAAALVKAAAADDVMLTKSVQTARANAIACYLVGGIFIACAGVSALMMPEPFLILFLSISGAGLITGGVLIGRVTKSQPSA